MADCSGDVMVDPKMAVANLVGPEAIAHNVYNHILLSPTQVSRNLALPPNQSLGLVGGRSRVGDRVIENFQSIEGAPSVPKAKPKDDGHRFSPSTSKSTDTSCIYEADSAKEILGGKEPQKEVCTITSAEAPCCSPTKDIRINMNEDDDGAVFQDECDGTSQGDMKDKGDDNQLHDVEEFIKFHVRNSTKRSTTTSTEVSPCLPIEEEPQCSLTVLQNLAQKTNEIIKHNRLLQQQIATLKKETTLQTKVLTKLLKKKQKRLQSSTKTN